MSRMRMLCRGAGDPDRGSHRPAQHASSFWLNGSTRPFSILLAGQVVSQIGHTLTGFGIAIWVLQETGSVVAFSMLLVIGLVTALLVTPFAGALVDRWDRRRTMILADVADSGIALLLAVLVWTGRLEVWYLYALIPILSITEAFQQPCLTASIAALVPRPHLSRAQGSIRAGQGFARVAGPVLAGFLLASIGMLGVLLVEFLTCMFAIATLLVIRIPTGVPASSGGATHRRLFSDAADGLRYVRERPGLRHLLAITLVVNLCLGMLQALLRPLALSVSTLQEHGTILSLMGLGMLSGGLIMSVWGGPERKIWGVLLGYGFAAASLVLMGIRPSPAFLGMGVLAFFFSFSIAASCSEALWQASTPSALQGRVAAVRIMAVQSIFPFAYAAAGPLADWVFEPLMAVGGGWALVVGSFIGVGPGRGIAVLIIGMGVIGMAAVAVAASSAAIFQIGDEEDVSFAPGSALLTGKTIFQGDRGGHSSIR